MSRVYRRATGNSAYRESRIVDGRGARRHTDLVKGALATHHVLLAGGLEGRAALHNTGQKDGKDGDGGNARELHGLSYLNEMSEAVRSGWEGEGMDCGGAVSKVLVKGRLPRVPRVEKVPKGQNEEGGTQGRRR